MSRLRQAMIDAMLLRGFAVRTHRICYGCGLRVTELLYLKVRDIDGERRLLRIDPG